jgi:hypothetical protein
MLSDRCLFVHVCVCRCVRVCAPVMDQACKTRLLQVREQEKVCLDVSVREC